MQGDIFQTIPDLEDMPEHESCYRTRDHHQTVLDFEEASQPRKLGFDEGTHAPGAHRFLYNPRIMLLVASPTPRMFQDYRLRFQKFAIESSSRTPNNAQDSDSRSAEWLRFNRPFRRYLGKAAMQVKSGNGVGTGKRLCKIYRVCIFSEPP
jgi:hypothetical protein